MSEIIEGEAVEERYPYSDTVAELQRVNALLEQIVQQLSGMVPRFYVELPFNASLKEKNEIQKAVADFFQECPPGGVKLVSLKEGQILGTRLKKIG